MSFTGFFGIVSYYPGGIAVSLNYESWPRMVRTYLFAIVVGLFFPNSLAAAFLAIDDIRRGGMWLLENCSATRLYPTVLGSGYAAF